MEKKQAITTKKIVLAAMLAALTTAGSALRITLPLEIAGTTSFHLGNILCALSGILLGPWLGGLASGLGSALYDVMNPLYISECWITFLTKGIYGLVAGAMFVYLFRRRSNYVTEVASTAVAAVTYIALYLSKKFFLDGMLVAGLSATAAWAAVIEAAPSSLFNGVVAVVIAPILGAAIQRALKAAHLERVLA